MPDDMDDEIAAQIFITTLTVVGMVETAAVPQVNLVTSVVSKGHCRHTFAASNSVYR